MQLYKYNGIPASILLTTLIIFGSLFVRENKNNPINSLSKKIINNIISIFDVGSLSYN